MSHNCTMCGVSLPDSHKHKTCSMCYGDIDYGTDGLYRNYMERCEREAENETFYEGLNKLDKILDEANTKEARGEGGD